MRTILLLTFSLLVFSGFVQAKKSPPNNAPIDIVVNRSKTCGCCGKWLEHLKNNNFNVVDNMLDDVQSIKTQHGVSPEMASCHTALVGGYVVEGHVPASDIKKLLASKPKVIGISVPGMPAGTPGMEMGDKQDAYQVLSFDKNQKTHVFSQYEAK
ncbi:MAG: DUF411 domain-containing protein [Methylococcaceae bacterium]|nr:DUF411 domain-containing protein [Methylococcaceae bacterium]